MLHDTFDPLAMGAAYAMYRHGQDEQADDLASALGQPGQNLGTGPAQQVDVHVHVSNGEDDPNAAVVNNLDFTTADMPQCWNDFIGQEPLKRQLRVAIAGARSRNEPLQNVLLASGIPGVGKTAMARLIAKTMKVDIIELVPPFNIYTLAKAAEQLYDRDILFIDEIHLLGMARSQMLLKIMDEKVAYMPDGEVRELNNITVIGATTDKNVLTEAVLERFKLKPFYQPYSTEDLILIAVQFADKHDALDIVDGELLLTIANASRGIPRMTEEFILALRDMYAAYGRIPTGQELLDFKEIEADGMTRTHVHYVTALRQYYRRSSIAFGVEYIAGEATMMSILRETKLGVQRLERFLTEKGYVNLTPRGRKLTARGIARAEQYILAGRGAADV